MQRIGAEACVGFAVEVSLSANAGMAFSWTKKRGWKWEGFITIPLECKIYAFIRLTWRDNLHIEGSFEVAADPAIKLEGTSAGLVLKSEKFKIDTAFKGVIKVSVWFYSYENKGDYPLESLSVKVPETELWNIIGN
jgi:hypothetical protein